MRGGGNTWATDRAAHTEEVHVTGVPTCPGPEMRRGVDNNKAGNMGQQTNLGRWDSKPPAPIRAAEWVLDEGSSANQEVRVKAIIVQGPGYYGVNIRLLTNEQAGAVVNEMDKRAPVYVSPSNDQTFTWIIGDGTMVQLVGIPEGQSFGFDTGWWDEAEKIINSIL